MTALRAALEEVRVSLYNTGNTAIVHRLNEALKGQP